MFAVKALFNKALQGLKRFQARFVII